MYYTTSSKITEMYYTISSEITNMYYTTPNRIKDVLHNTQWNNRYVLHYHQWISICSILHPVKYIENTTRVPVGDDLSYNECFLKRI